jgi:hypothetical protein
MKRSAITSTFLLGEAQPKNALITSTPQIRKQIQKFKRAHSMLQFYSAGMQFYIFYKFIIFSTFAQAQSKCLLLLDFRGWFVNHFQARNLKVVILAYIGTYNCTIRFEIF